MKHMFGFCEDYDKIVCGLKHNLTLVRIQFLAAKKAIINLKNEDDECFKWAITPAFNSVTKTLNVLIKNFENNQRSSIGMV